MMIGKWEITEAEHRGGRDEQQDRVAIFSAPNDKIHLLVVADGMGGHKDGHLAAQIVVKSAELIWNKSKQGQVTSPFKFLQHICDLAHKNINNLGKIFSPRSTCVLLYLRGKRAWWLHLGDSRLYHFGPNKLLFQTKDHSVVQMLADLGRITEAEMATHPDQGSLLKGVGGDEAIKPEFGQAAINSGDSFVLCSDGFWEHVSGSQMLDRLSQTGFTLKKRVKRLLKDALDAGGAKGDNLTVAVAQFQGKKLFNIISYIVIGIIILALLTITTRIVF